MTEAEEHHIHLFKRHLTGEAQVGIADEALVHVAHQIARIALAVGKHDVCLWVCQQYAYEFTACVAGCSQYSYAHHAYLSSSG